MSKNNLLYSWGASDKGQLGISATDALGGSPTHRNHRSNFSKPTLVEPAALLGKYADVGIIRQAKCGSEFSAAVMEPTGDVITWGEGSSGQLGCGADVTESPNPLKVERLHDAGITTAACGTSHMAVVNSKGQVLTWGAGSDGQLGHVFTPTPKQPCHPNVLHPQVVGGFDNATSVACGKSHTLALTRDGAVYGWGATVAGQAGFENQGRTCYTPQKLPNLRCKMICISAGELHSAAVAENGMCYTWGWGEKGRLGHGNEATISQPTLVNRLANEIVVSAACGAGHTMVSTREGKIFSWGAGTVGQLGHGSWGNRFRPSRIAFLNDSPVRQIACGSWHSAAITTKGELYCWGCGEAGQLGNGDDENNDENNQCLPRLVRSLLGKECQFVSCGTQHTMAIVENTRYKKPVDQALLDNIFMADETRRKAALKKCDRIHIERRKKQASLDLGFVQGQVSKSAADFMSKHLKRTKQAAANNDERQNPEVQSEAKQHEKRPFSARTTVSEVSLCRTGYQSHRYRSELRQTLRDMGLQKSQMPAWGEPAHFVPVPPPASRAAGNFSRASGITSLEHVSLSPSVSHAERAVSRQSAASGRGHARTTRRPATARTAVGASEQDQTSRSANATAARPSTARSHDGRMNSGTRLSTSRMQSPAGLPMNSSRGSSRGEGFRPPPSWGHYWNPQ